MCNGNILVVIIVVKIGLVSCPMDLRKIFQVKDRYFGFKGTWDRGCVRLEE